MEVIQFVLIVIMIIFSSCRGDENAGSGRVTGGWNAFAGQLPFVAAVHHNGEFLCGGAIIDDCWILTSATCVSGIPTVPPITVKVGGILHSLVVIEPGSLVITVKSTHIHWSFNPEETQDVYEYNMALLELQTSILPNNALMSPIEMASEAVAAGTRLYLAGWGGQSNSLPVEKLQYTDRVTVMDIQDCSNHVGMLLNDNYVCTLPYPMHTACHFDEGGPLFSVDPATGLKLLGIASYTSCTTPNIPTIYSSVYSRDNKEWINNKIPGQNEIPVQ